MKVSANKESPAPRQLGHRRLGWTFRLLAGLAGACLVAVLAWPRDTPAQLLKQARIDYEAKRYEQADARLAELARLRSPSSADWMLRGEVAIGRKQVDDALADFERIPDTDKLAPRARFKQGQAELRRHRVRAAEEAFLHALRLDPKLVQARRELVFIYGMQLRRPEVSAQFSALADLVPLTFDDVFNWCLLRNVIWDTAETVTDLQRYVEADPTDRASRLALAETLRQLRRLDEADQVLSVLPDSDPDARATRVRLAFDRNDETTAEELLAGGPADHAGLARLRGRLAFNRRDWSAALEHMRMAYARDPLDRETLSILGRSLERLGDDKAAAPFLEAARNEDMLNGTFQLASGLRTQHTTPKPEVLRQLGAACAAANRLPEARAWYRLALSLDPLDQKAQQSLYQLNKQATEPKENGS
jgi:tetratricopeptide (TPR) repeat protein